MKKNYSLKKITLIIIPLLLILTIITYIYLINKDKENSDDNNKKEDESNGEQQDEDNKNNDNQEQKSSETQEETINDSSSDETKEEPMSEEDKQGNEKIIISSPKKNSEINSPVQIQGQAIGPWFFEGNFTIQIIDNQGNKIGESLAYAQENYMTDHMVPFSAEINFNLNNSQQGKIIFKRANPSGLPENAESFELPIQIKNN